MRQIQPSKNQHSWPRKAVAAVDCRKTDLVVRIADWSKDKDESAYDVEVYIGGVYDFNESKTFTKSEFGSLAVAKAKAIEFASKQIAKLM